MTFFGWVLWHVNHYNLFNVKSSLYAYIQIYMIWFGWVLLHINRYKLFNVTSSLYIYIIYIYGFVWLDFKAYQPLYVIYYDRLLRVNK